MRYGVIFFLYICIQLIFFSILYFTIDPLTINKFSLFILKVVFFIICTWPLIYKIFSKKTPKETDFFEIEYLEDFSPFAVPNVNYKDFTVTKNAELLFLYDRELGLFNRLDTNVEVGDKYLTIKILERNEYMTKIMYAKGENEYIVPIDKMQLAESKEIIFKNNRIINLKIIMESGNYIVFYFMNEAIEICEIIQNKINF